MPTSWEGRNDPLDKEGLTIREKNIQWTVSENYRWMPVPPRDPDEIIGPWSSVSSDNVGGNRDELEEAIENQMGVWPGGEDSPSGRLKKILPAYLQEATKDERGRLSPAQQIFFYRHAMAGARQRVYEQEKIQAYQTYLREEMADAQTIISYMEFPMEMRAYALSYPRFGGLKDFRQTYWESVYQYFQRVQPHDEVEAIKLAQAEKLTGRVPKLSSLNLRLFEELRALAERDTDGLIEGMQEILQTNFHFQPTPLASKKLWQNLEEADRKSRLERESGLSDEEVLERDAANSAEFTQNIYLDDSLKEAREARQKLRAKESFSQKQLRNYIEKNYGQPLLSPLEENQLNQAVAYGNHKGERILLTHGLEETARLAAQLPDSAKKPPVAAYRLQLMKEAREANQKYALLHRHEIHRAIMVLVEKLKSTLAEQGQEGREYAVTGRLAGQRVWRNLYLDKRDIFLHKSTDEPTLLQVDILLDASASQEDRQAQVAVQGYILAEALRQVGIPFRLTAFHSQMSYTILQELRDYEDRGPAEEVLSYFADAANRDGLALRAVHYRMRKRQPYKNLLVVLSDGKPFDSRIKINGKVGGPKQYKDEFAVNDTADEVRQIRSSGVPVFGLFTGREEELEDAKKIYGSSFAYIKNINRFAGIVSRYLQDMIRG